MTDRQFERLLTQIGDISESLRQMLAAMQKKPKAKPRTPRT